MNYNQHMIYLAADHRGFQLKEAIKKMLHDQKYPMEDMGAFQYDEMDDYVDFARIALEKMADDPEVHRGIFICGSGHGMNIVADKYKEIRAVLGYNRYVAVQGRQHEDANVLILASDWVKDKEAEVIVNDWLTAEFAGEERHVRRLKKIEAIEVKNFM